MAESPAHKFGQVIGDVLEEAIEPLLRQFTREHDLYLDKKGPRPARRGTKVRWTDSSGNTHDLDFVLERGGDDQHIGTPVAFIETAWRRYTKHSRNKAQEIQGAIIPLKATFQNASPFIGTILAGIFTEGALAQLQSLGFTVLYFPYETVVSAFATIGLDAHFEEDTPDAEFTRKLRAWEAMSPRKRKRVAATLVKSNSGHVQQFMDALRRSITRQIELVRVMPLHGAAFEWHLIQEAIAFIEGYNENDGSKPVVRYEIEIRYNSGDRINGQFADKEGAIQFLRAYQPTAFQPTSVTNSRSTRRGKE
jgi:hypothetical protein